MVELRSNLRLLLAVVATVSSALIKLIGGVIGSSLALLADWLDSLVNVFTISTATLFFIKSKEPPDKEHPYGHYGYDALSALITSVVMVSLASIIGVLSVMGLLGAHKVAGSAIVYSLASTLLLFLTALLIFRASKSYGSMALRAEYRHLMVDVLESLLVFLGVLLSVNVDPRYDLLTSLGVTAFMVRNAAVNIREVSQCLLYEMPAESLAEEIRRLSVRLKGVSSCHSIRIRRQGEALFVDLHLLVDPSMTVMEAHELAHSLERKIKEKNESIKDVVIHVEPA